MSTSCTFHFTSPIYKSKGSFKLYDGESDISSFFPFDALLFYFPFLFNNVFATPISDFHSFSFFSSLRISKLSGDAKIAAIWSIRFLACDSAVDILVIGFILNNMVPGVSRANAVSSASIGPEVSPVSTFVFYTYDWLVNKYAK